MLNKKAIELSINFFVVIVLSMALFGLGIVFIKNLGSQATSLKDITIAELDERIGDLVCEGSDRVCIGGNRKTIVRGNFDVFGVRIFNILDSQKFDILVARPSPSGYTIDNKEIQKDNLIVYPESRTDESIKKNEERKLAIAVQVPADAVPGTYIFNVEIRTYIGGNYGLYSPIQKLYVEVPK